MPEVSDVRPLTPTTGQIYRSFDIVIRRVESRLAKAPPRTGDCDPAHVSARLIQRVVEKASEGFTRVLMSLGTDGMNDLEVVELGGLRISLHSGRMSVLPREQLRNAVDFAAMWVRFFVSVVRSIARPSPNRSQRATLLMEAGGYTDSDEELVRFCRQGPITPLRSAERLIVAAASPPLVQTDPAFSYSRAPLEHFVTTHLSRRDKCSLLLRHVLAPFSFARALVSSPLCILLGRDLSVLPAVRWLDSRGLLDAIVTTTSSFTSQPLWMKGIKGQRSRLHMLWYSQNFLPKTYVGESESSDLPAARHMRVDVHWVWTADFEKYLRNLGQTGEINAVGPILWYLPKPLRGPVGEGFRVALFDITPVNPGNAVFGAGKNYYTAETMGQFVTDIVTVCREIEAEAHTPVELLLKHKRAARAGQHDPAYLSFLDTLVEDTPGFSMVEHNTNLFGLLATCDISVSVPYTSTAYVAAHLRKPAIYYDPFGELVPIFARNEFVQFAAGRAELKSVLASLLVATQTSTASR